MKVTNNMTYRLMQSEMNQITNRLYDLRQAASSGKKFNQPSDDPSAVRPVLNYTTQIKANQRYQENMGMALNKLKAQDSHLDHTENLLVKVQNHTIHAINGSLNQSDKETLADQVKQMKNELLATANAQLNGRHLFAGYEEEAPPFTMDKNGKVSYQGDDKIQNVEIAPGEKLGVSIPGRELFLGQKDTNNNGQADTKIGDDIFKNLDNIEKLIRSENNEVSGSFGGNYEGWEYKDDENFDTISFNLKLAEKNFLTIDVNMSSDHNSNAITNKTQLADEIGYKIATSFDDSCYDSHDPDNPGGNILDDESDSITLKDGNDNQVTIKRNGDNGFNFETNNKTSFKIENFSESTNNNDDAGPDAHIKATMQVSSNPGTKGDTILRAGDNESAELTKSSLMEELAILKENMDRLRIHRGSMGITMNRIETSMDHKEKAENDLKQILSKYQDADIIETSTKIVQQETALKAALNVSSRIARLSILDYL